MSVATSQPVRASAPVRLRPREHGAYTILAIPLLPAVLIGGLSTVGILTIVAAVAGFMAHEPLMVAWGRRGQRAQSATPAAMRLLLSLLLVAGVSGIAAVWLATDRVRVALVGCTVLAGIGFAISVSGRQRNLAAQLVGIVGLTLPSAAVMLSGGVDFSLAVGLCSAWVLGRVATTTAVSGVVARNKSSMQRRVPMVNDLILALVAAAFVFGMSSGIREWTTIVPLLMAALALRFWPPAMKDIRSLGWRLVAVNVVTCLWMVAWYAPRLVQ